MSDIRTFDGAVAVITGGASGIGAALAKQIAARGGTIVIGDRQAQSASVAVRRRDGADCGVMSVTAAKPLVDVRADFPLLSREFDGKRLVYLD